MESSSLQHISISQGDLMREARADLTGKWGTGVAIMLIYIAVGIGMAIIPFSSFVLSGPLSLGFTMVGLGFARQGNVEVATLFDGFKNFGKAFGLSVLMGIAVLFAFMFFIIPGVILSLGWGMSMFILADNPEMRVIDVLEHSWELTKGYKLDLFVLGLKFFFLGLLCLLTLGIGFLFLVPYYQTVMAKYYLQLKKAKGYDEEDDDITKHLVV